MLTILKNFKNIVLYIFFIDKKKDFDIEIKFEFKNIFFKMKNC